MINHIFTVILLILSVIQQGLDTCSTSWVTAATFQGLKTYMWLVAMLLNRAVTDKEDGDR